MRVLILGGTGEARSLAAGLIDRPGFAITSSLAGRVRDPALPVGDVRIGGFGGVDGLVTYLRDQQIAAVVDATHPFAATMSAHAAQAAGRSGVPLLVLRRPGWTEEPGDDWHRVPDIASAAAAAAAAPPGCVFVTTGRRDLAAFAADGSHRHLVRTVDPPAAPLPRRMSLVLDRGPYTVEGEGALMDEHGVVLLVTKDSGGPMTRAKTVAARERRIPVVVVDRPPLPPGVPVVATVEAATAWLDSVAG
ncbi:MAG: precorrin-6A/cobalt-precorrin-6A reductase [Pseudonocardiales bacterium]|nr:precorrin-6A/cobalt-precorrin-6A reductase [Pseudonocardiales bacterium]